MKRLFISIALGLSLSHIALADVWSLDSCINYAVSHNLNIKAADIELMQSENSVTEAKDAFLPTLSGQCGSSVIHAPISPCFITSRKRRVMRSGCR